MKSEMFFCICTCCSRNMAPSFFHVCSLLWVILILSILADSEDVAPSEDSQAVCVEDGTHNCDGESQQKENDTPEEPLDHTSHIWAMPKDHDCEDKKPARDCKYWHESGVCERNPGFMIFSCPKTCGYCHLKDPKIRCSRHPQAKPAVGPGDINKMFERLLTDFPQYSPEVFSRDPWVVVLNDVFSDEECDTLVEVGGKNFRRSVDAGAMKGDGAQFEPIISDSRTSETDWCTGSCWKNEIINGMAQKAENITLIPKENSEYFQVLKYEVGQYYVQHHDYIYGHLDLPIGPRIYTFFIYLNTPDKGGGTKFNKLGFEVPAKKGRVAIWPSVLDEDPYKKEMRTNHEARPVEEGRKYGANMWLHMYNFHDPFKLTCTG